MDWFRRLALLVSMRTSTRIEILGLQQKLWRYVCKREGMLPRGASYFALPRRRSEVSRKSSGLDIAVSGMGDQKSGRETHGRNRNSHNSVITSRSSRNSYHEMAQVAKPTLVSHNIESCRDRGSRDANVQRSPLCAAAPCSRLVAVTSRTSAETPN